MAPKTAGEVLLKEADQIRILGMALARGLVSGAQLREAFAQGDPLEVLQRNGVLDAEDLSILERLLAQDAQDTDPAVPLPDGFPDARSANPLASGEISEALRTLWQRPEPISGDDSGRRVLRALSLPEWRQYRNLRFVGEGGMGRIFKAYDPSLKRMVALKFLRREDPELVLRFTMEAQHQAMVDHPNVCRVYEVGEWHGQSYIAMQFLKGETLEVAAASLDLDETLDVLEQVAEAVHAAHRQGLIHRDLKPANIMVERLENGRPRPCILDFGLARGLEPSGLSVAGMLVGTTLYMAPEQARGDQAAVDRRTDVYALGATLYRLLAGRAPFGDSAGLDVVRRVQDEDAPPLRRLAPDLPRDLETIVMKCLEREPVRRYESARALAEDLRRLRDGEPILAHRPSRAYRLGKWARRNRVLVAVAGVALFSVLTLGGLAAAARVTAAARARHAQHFGQEAERIEALLRYAHLQPAHDIRPELAQARARFAALQAEAARLGRLAGDPAAYAEGRLRLALGEPEAAMPLLRRVWDAGLRTPDVALALGRCAGELYQRERQRALLIPSPELRAARLKALEAERLGPALAWLAEGRLAALEAPAYFEAQWALYQGRLDEALARAREAVAQVPWLFEARLLEGEARLRQAEEAPTPEAGARLAGEALEVCRRAAAQAPSAPAARVLLARASAQLSRCAASLEAKEAATARGLAACREGLALDPGHRELRRLEAERLVDTGALEARRGGDPEPRFAAAQASLERLQEEAPGDVAVLESLAGLWEQRVFFGGQEASRYLGATEQALRWLDLALAQEPTAVELHQAVAQAHVRRMARRTRLGQTPWEDFEASLGALRRALALQPGSPTLANAAAMLWVERAEYERTHGLDPGPSLAWIRRLARLEGSRSERLQGAAALAYGALIQVQDAAARGQATLGPLAACRRAVGDWEALDPGRDTPPLTLAEALMAVAKEALEAGGDPVELLGEAQGLLARGRARGRSNLTLDALEIRVALLEGRRGVPGALEAARRKAAALARREPGEAEGHQLLAEALLWQGDVARGLAASGRALALHPGWPEGLLVRGLLLGKAGRQQESRACLAEAAARDPRLKRRLARLAL